MLIGQKGVKYGLTVPKQKPKQSAPAVTKKSVFGEEDSDDDPQANVEQQIARQAARKQIDKKVADIHAAALAEDPSIFDYDAHYDDIQAARVEPKRQEKVQRQSKYITTLLEKAEERKREQSILYERQLAKERAAEDHLFGDKERFVTAAYRKKLEEDKKWLEEEAKKRAQEEKEAVEKKGHMGDFYRNLFRSNVAFGAKPGEKTKQQQQQHEGEVEQQGIAQPSAERETATLAQPHSGGARGGLREAPGKPAAAEAGQDKAPAGWEAARAAQDSRAGSSGAGREAMGEASASAAAAAAAEDGGALTAKLVRREEGRAEAGGAAPPQPAAAGRQLPSEQPLLPQQQQQAAAEAGQRRNREDAVAAARERYLARKRKAAGLE